MQSVELFSGAGGQLSDCQMTTAMGFVRDVLEKNRQKIILAQGDCLYLDNFFAVHGRAAYRPDYGPNGRWFCRLVMTRDLRKTRALRATSDGRIMLDRDYARAALSSHARSVA